MEFSVKLRSDEELVEELITEALSLRLAIRQKNSRDQTSIAIDIQQIAEALET